MGIVVMIIMGLMIVTYGILAYIDSFEWKERDDDEGHNKDK